MSEPGERKPDEPVDPVDPIEPEAGTPGAQGSDAVEGPAHAREHALDQGSSDAPPAVRDAATGGEGEGQGQGASTGDDMAMPGGAGSGNAGSVTAPAGWGRQMAQLVLIPAMIVIVVIGLGALFGMLGGKQETLDTLVHRLKQSGGMGRIIGDFQDPAYKDRWRAAANIAAFLRPVDDEQDPGRRHWPHPLDDPAKRTWLSGELVLILDDSTADHEANLRVFLLEAIGILSEPDHFGAVRQRLTASEPRQQQAAILATMRWHDREQARTAMVALTQVLTTAPPEPRAMAAMALGQLAQAEDDDVVDALRAATRGTTREHVDTYLNAAIALALLGEAEGNRIVAEELLNREAMGLLVERGGRVGMTEPERVGWTDRAMLATLGHVPQMTDQRIWDRVKVLSETDPNRRVQSVARVLLHNRVQPGS